MEHTQLIYTIFISALFCLGWSFITDKGNILYFLRAPFEQAIDNIEQYENRLDVVTKFDSNNIKALKYLKRMIVLNNLVYYIGKPFVLCITCYSSLWGFSIFVTLNGFSIDTLPLAIINSVSAAFVNTIIYKLYAKLD